MKLYIAGPMTGIRDLNYPAFLDAERRLTEAGFQVASPHRIDQLKPVPCGHAEYRDEVRYLKPVAGCEDCDSRTWQWYMREAIKMLVECDDLAALPGWQRSRGAKVEWNLGVSIGMNPMYVDIWIRAANEGRIQL